MSDDRPIVILRLGARVWNEWRKHHPDGEIDLRAADLWGRDLRGAKLDNVDLGNANLRASRLAEASLRDSNLRNANLRGADLRGANLRAAFLFGADLTGADLTGADLNEAYLRFANLTGAILESAFLKETHLTHANLTGANLNEAILKKTRLEHTNLTATVFCASVSEVDLSQAEGLAEIHHPFSSDIATTTLERTAEGLSRNPSNRSAVEAFLRHAGVPDPIMRVFSSMVSGPEDFFSCFISYSREDSTFAQLMYRRLRKAHIRCYLDQHQCYPATTSTSRSTSVSGIGTRSCSAALGRL